MWTSQQRRRRFVSVLVAGVAGLAIFFLVWFIVPQTLEDADRWMSVVGGLVTAIAAAVSLLVWLFRRSSASTASAGGPTSNLTAGRDIYQAREMTIYQDRNDSSETAPYG